MSQSGYPENEEFIDYSLYQNKRVKFEKVIIPICKPPMTQSEELRKSIRGEISFLYPQPFDKVTLRAIEMRVDSIIRLFDQAISSAKEEERERIVGIIDEEWDEDSNMYVYEDCNDPECNCEQSAKEKDEEKPQNKVLLRLKKKLQALDHLEQEEECRHGAKFGECFICGESL